MDGLEVEEVVVAHVDTDAEVEAGIPSVDDLEVPNILYCQVRDYRFFLLQALFTSERQRERK